MRAMLFAAKSSGPEGALLEERHASADSVLTSSSDPCFQESAARPKRSKYGTHW
jgi:hypothetical protein